MCVESLRLSRPPCSLPKLHAFLQVYISDVPHGWDNIPDRSSLRKGWIILARAWEVQSLNVVMSYLEPEQLIAPSISGSRVSVLGTLSSLCAV